MLKDCLQAKSQSASSTMSKQRTILRIPINRYSRKRTPRVQSLTQVNGLQIFESNLWEIWSKQISFRVECGLPNRIQRNKENSVPMRIVNSAVMLPFPLWTMILLNNNKGKYSIIKSDVFLVFEDSIRWVFSSLELGLANPPPFLSSSSKRSSS